MKCIDCKTWPKSPGRSRCKPCYTAYRKRTMKPKECPDCGTFHKLRNTRCEPCRYAYRAIRDDGRLWAPISSYLAKQAATLVARPSHFFN